MLCSKSLPLSLLLFSLLLNVAIAADPINNFCFGENYTANSTYGTNLKTLLNTLSTRAPSTGFASGSYSEGQDSAYGLALCRGDVSKSDCKTCVNDAIKKLLQQCPQQKGAIIWYDYCMLKYSDSYFFGKIDNQNMFYMYNALSVTDPTVFDQQVQQLLNSLSSNASASQKLYAAGQQQIVGTEHCTDWLNVLEIFLMLIARIAWMKP